MTRIKHRYQEYDHHTQLKNFVYEIPWHNTLEPIRFKLAEVIFYLIHYDAAYQLLVLNIFCLP